MLMLALDASATFLFFSICRNRYISAWVWSLFHFWQHTKLTHTNANTQPDTCCPKQVSVFDGCTGSDTHTSTHSSSIAEFTCSARWACNNNNNNIFIEIGQWMRVNEKERDWSDDGKTRIKWNERRKKGKKTVEKHAHCQCCDLFCNRLRRQFNETVHLTTKNRLNRIINSFLSGALACSVCGMCLHVLGNL